MRNRLPLVLLASVLVAPAFAQSPAAPAPGNAPTAQVYNYKTPQLHRAAVDALLAEPSKVLFVDLRRPDEISKIGSFPVYLNVQIGDLEKDLAFVPKDRKIVTVSNHAARAGKAGDVLTEKGFNVVGAVGSQIYEEEGGTILRVVPPAPQAASAAAPAAKN
ncbi:rhodanese-related sulfurtransferase [Bradyrhizobium sp. USDA 4341]